ncbi:uncharacterized protein TNCV_1537061 [Trichonephila clavipes]|nr:uncharacterized protein TNCV_1537061 [Trichonephila clavipes]
MLVVERKGRLIQKANLRQSSSFHLRTYWDLSNKSDEKHGQVSSMKRKGQDDPEKKNLFRRKLRESYVSLTSELILLTSCAYVDKQSWTTKKTEDYDLPSVMELLKDCKDYFKGLKSDTAFNEMLCDARELADEIDIPVNFELTQPHHRVQRRNVNFDYKAQDEI